MFVEASAVLTSLNIMSAEVSTDASCLYCSNHSPLIAVACSRVGVGSGGAIGAAFGAAAAAAPLPELAAAAAGIGGTGGGGGSVGGSRGLSCLTFGESNRVISTDCCSVRSCCCGGDGGGGGPGGGGGGPGDAIGDAFGAAAAPLPDLAAAVAGIGGTGGLTAFGTQRSHW